jgi:hypothetical protein
VNAAASRRKVRRVTDSCQCVGGGFASGQSYARGMGPITGKVTPVARRWAVTFAAGENRRKVMGLGDFRTRPREIGLRVAKGVCRFRSGRSGRVRSLISGASDIPLVGLFDNRRRFADRLLGYWANLRAPNGVGCHAGLECAFTRGRYKIARC